MATQQGSGMLPTTVKVIADKTESPAAAAAVGDFLKPAPQEEDDLSKPGPPAPVLCASSTQQLEQVIEPNRLKNKALVLPPCDDQGSTGDNSIAPSTASAANQAPGKQGPGDTTPGLDIATRRREAASPGQPVLPPSGDASEGASRGGGFEQPQGDSGSATSNPGLVSSDQAADGRDGRRVEDPDWLTTEDADNDIASARVLPAESACSSVAQKQPALPTGVHPSDKVTPAGLQGACSLAAQEEPAPPSDDLLEDGVTAVASPSVEPQPTACPASQRGSARARIYDRCLRDEQQAVRRLRDDGEAGRRQECALGIPLHDAEGPVVDLRAARRQREAYRWATSCLACRELSPEVFIWPCGHGIVCGRCLWDPSFSGELVASCPVCTKPKEGLKFSDDLLDYIRRRSMK